MKFNIFPHSNYIHSDSMEGRCTGLPIPSRVICSVDVDVDVQRKSFQFSHFLIYSHYSKYWCCVGINIFSSLEYSLELQSARASCNLHLPHNHNYYYIAYWIPIEFNSKWLRFMLRKCNQFSSQLNIEFHLE